jgi:hypothetical protein
MCNKRRRLPLPILDGSEYTHIASIHFHLKIERQEMHFAAGLKSHEEISHFKIENQLKFALMRGGAVRIKEDNASVCNIYN